MTKNFNMGDRKPTSIESAIKDVWKNAAENNMSGEQSFEVGTDRYAKHTTDLTPGQKVEEEYHNDLINMLDEDFDKLIEESTEEELEYIIELFGIGKAAKAIGRGIKKVATSDTTKKIGKAVGKKIKSVAVNSKGNSRLSAAGKADSAEKKLGKANAKNADIKRGNKAKAKLGKLKKVKPEETEMSQEEFKKYVPDGTRMMSEQLNHVRMWQEAAGGEKEDLDKSPENTAKKMKRAEEPKPNIATESVVAEGELPPALKKAIDAKKKKSGDEEETEEELSAKQKAIDLNKNGKVDGEDLAKLRKKGDKKEDVQEGGVKKAMMNDAESMDKDKFVKKYGKEMSDAAAQWDSMNEEMTIPQAQDFKVQSMKHALAKVWGMDDMSEGELPPALKKAIDAKKKGKEEAEEDMKGNKTETGKKAAVIEIEPQLDKKK